MTLSFPGFELLFCRGWGYAFRDFRFAFPSRNQWEDSAAPKCVDPITHSAAKEMTTRPPYVPTLTGRVMPGALSAMTLRLDAPFPQGLNTQ